MVIEESKQETRSGPLHLSLPCVILLGICLPLFLSSRDCLISGHNYAYYRKLTLYCRGIT
jgi:hypothetical protein